MRWTAFVATGMFGVAFVETIIGIAGNDMRDFMAAGISALIGIGVAVLSLHER